MAALSIDFFLPSIQTLRHEPSDFPSCSISILTCSIDTILPACGSFGARSANRNEVDFLDFLNTNVNLSRDWPSKFAMHSSSLPLSGGGSVRANFLSVGMTSSLDLAELAFLVHFSTPK